MELGGKFRDIDAHHFSNAVCCNFLVVVGKYVAHSFGVSIIDFGVSGLKLWREPADHVSNDLYDPFARSLNHRVGVEGAFKPFIIEFFGGFENC